MQKISAFAAKEKVGELFFETNENKFGFNYLKNTQPISLIMPYKASTYSLALRTKSNHT